ncbi:MAG TPA: phosphatase PAP2 family protein [Mycobacteriales bacterium]|nr:phosphatase PAP2 family protein [Mycobacteriales bacterium]
MQLHRVLHRLDEAGYVLAHRGDSQAVDTGLAWVTRSADFSAIWLAAAAVLAGTGGRRGRRAAARGLLSLGLTSALANGPLKTAVRRPRPGVDLIPVGRSRHRRTRTSSFPSGHSASAAAFAVGASSELPAAAAVLAPMATLVGISRVRTGAHYPGDVVAGMALGAGVALATRRVWPVPPGRPAAVGRPDPALASRDGAGVRVVANPDAGPSGSKTPTDVLMEQLPRLEVVEHDGDDLLEALQKAASGATALGAAGGDGSVNAAAATAMEHDLPLLVVPAGTLNHFARDVGLDSAEDAAAAVHAGSVTEVDVGLIGDQVFLNTASLGSYAELVHAREKLEGRIGKWPAVVVALGGVLRGHTPVELEIDGSHRRVWMVFFGNCRYRPSGFAPSWRERLDDGLVDVRVVDAEMPFARARLLLAVLTGTLGRCRVYEQRTAQSVRIRSLEGPLKVARDGEVEEGPEELVVRKAAQRLRVYAPELTTS